MTSSLLLLSGGLDSACIAALLNAPAGLFVDYGQLPAAAERDAARMVSGHLSLQLHEVRVDLSSLGQGLLVGRAKTDGPTPEWFPFRNQFLLTIAACVALGHGYDSVVIGLVGGDGDRHADGKSTFVETIDQLVAHQEGNVRITAPYVDVAPAELLRSSDLPRHLLWRTHSCHVGNLACGQCPGCERRTQLLSHAGLESVP